MSRMMSFRPRTDSALDAIADGPQARAIGLTRRLHQVADRYALLMECADLPVIPDHLMVALATVKVRGPLTMPTDVLADTMISHKDRAMILAILEDFSVLQLVALIEGLEDRRARDHAAHTGGPSSPASMG